MDKRYSSGKMLFFRTQADEADVDGIDDQLCIPASRLVSMSPASITTIEMLFHSVKNNILQSNEQLTYDKVTLTVTRGDVQEVMDALVQKINSYPHSNGFIVIADDCATTDSAVTALANNALPTSYAHPSISGIASITVAAKLYRAPSGMLGTGNATMTAISNGLALAVNTHYKSINTVCLMTIPAASAGKAGDWITVTYGTIIDNGVVHSYTSTSDDTSFAAGSVLISPPGADDSNGTRIGRVDECSGSGDNTITITGLTDGDGGIGTTMKFVNLTGTVNGWAVEGMIMGQDDQDALSTVAFG